MTWGQELVTALGAVSATTGTSYLSALESALPKGSAAADLQAIATNGWNSINPNYGADITSGVQIQSLVNCLQANGKIPGAP
jgi:hypothetical protein